MTDKNTVFYQKSTVNCRGKLVDLSRPAVMGILNLTPDSFYKDSRHRADSSLLSTVEQMLNDGATFLDIGGQSTRPGAELINADDELKRVIPAIESIRNHFPEALISIDTFHAKVAKDAVEAGAVLVNDVSGGTADDAMFDTVAKLEVPYILMHMRGTAQTMNELTEYNDLITDIFDYFRESCLKLEGLGVKDIILDPGFGFAKTLEQNYELLKGMSDFRILGKPLLVGVSRKSMICKLLGVSPDNALNGTSAVHMLALQQGAKILRVHDVREAKECIRIFEAYKGVVEA